MHHVSEFHDLPDLQRRRPLRRHLVRGFASICLHGGYLPDYKGNHCIFFAYYERALEKVGSTIHLVAAGVDTGAIIDKLTVPVTAEDVPESSYCKAEMLAIHRLVALLEDLENGQSLKTTPQAPGGRTYRTRDRRLWHEIRLWLRLGRLVPGSDDSTNLGVDGAENA